MTRELIFLYILSWVPLIVHTKGRTVNIFQVIGRCVCWMYGDDTSNLPPIEKWSVRVSDKFGGKDLPADIIANAVAVSIKEKFEGWEMQGALVQDWAKGKDYATRTELSFPSKRIVINFGFHQQWKDKKFSWRRLKATANSCRVNNIPMTSRGFRLIRDTWNTQQQLHLKVAETTAKAKAEMELNEAAWNLVEKLLGMRRNEHGALVPVDTIEEA